MKNVLVLFAFLMSCTLLKAQVHAQVLVPFHVQYVPVKPVGNHPPKSPAVPPTVYLEDNTLTFVADHPEYVLYIKDEDEEVVYSTVVTSAETEVMLPSYLSGTYEIELVMGNWLFTGWIDL